MSLTGFRRIDIPIAGGELVRGRQHGLLQENLSNAHIQTVPLGRFPALCLPCLFLLGSFGLSIEEGLGSDILQTGFQDLTVFKKRIERIDMRTDGLGQGGICGVILGGMFEQMLPSESIKIDRPIGISRSGSHGEGLGMEGWTAGEEEKERNPHSKLGRGNFSILSSRGDKSGRNIDALTLRCLCFCLRTQGSRASDLMLSSCINTDQS